MSSLPVKLFLDISKLDMVLFNRSAWLISIKPSSCRDVFDKFTSVIALFVLSNIRSNRASESPLCCRPLNSGVDDKFNFWIV